MGLPIKPFFIGVSIVCAIGFAGSSWAATVEVSDADGLRQALMNAESDTEDTTIILAAGEYHTGITPFSYTPTENKFLTLAGAGMDETFLDGDQAVQVLLIEDTISDKTITIRDLTFRDGNGSDIGGCVKLLTDNAGFLIESTRFINCISSTDGGAINVMAGGDGTLTNCEFIDNRTLERGGAGRIAVNPGNLTVSGCLVQNNSAVIFSGGLRLLALAGNVLVENNQVLDNVCDGGTGGFNAEAPNGSVLARGNLIHNNRAGGISGMSSGTVGGMSLGGGGITIVDNTITQNEATQGTGGFSATNTNDNIVFNNNTVLDNFTQNSFVGGGSLISTSGFIEAVNNIISRNSAAIGAGGLLVVTGDGTANIIFNTVVANVALEQGGGILMSAGMNAAVANLYNNIAFNNVAVPGMGEDILFSNDAAPFAEINLFNNNFAEFCVSQGDCDPLSLGMGQGDNLIDVDPELVDPANDNFFPGAGSPVLDAATESAPIVPDTDHDGRPRVEGAAPDMGALEAVSIIAIDPDSFNFGEVNSGQESTQEFTITNIGGAELELTDAVLSDMTQYILDLNGGANPCGTLTRVLMGGQNCTLTVTFKPDGAGVFDVILSIASNDPLQPTLEVALTGTGLAKSGGCALVSHEPLAPTGVLTVMFLVLAVMGLYRCRA